MRPCPATIQLCMNATRQANFFPRAISWPGNSLNWRARSRAFRKKKQDGGLGFSTNTLMPINVANNSVGNKDSDWVNRLLNRQTYTAEYQDLKFTIHRKLLDRINLELLSSFAGERARAEIRA